MDNNEIFQYGSEWIKADFHLHTKADNKHFKYIGEENQFINIYVQALKQANIRVGLITNHNKFDYREFKALKKKSLKEGIYLIPGVELSVNEGTNGIHTIIAFSEEWIEDGKDYINTFLNATFAPKTSTEFENNDRPNNENLLDTIKRLDEYCRDYFLIFAHVEQKNGFWHELGGGRIEDLGKTELFKQRTAAFQKVRTHDAPDKKCRTKVLSWLKDWYPAEVEGSDCKSIEEVGQGNLCFIKIGDFNFQAIKYALLDYQNRVALQPSQYTHSHLCHISFEGGLLDGKTIYFSPELNNLIGIRGSGKSSILEAVRYVLGIPFNDKEEDVDYKKKLPEHTLKSGGKATIVARDRRGQEYHIRRILNEPPDVYINDVLQPGLLIGETILYKPIYFGQKELSSSGKGFEKKLVEKLMGERLSGIRERIEGQRRKVNDAIIRLNKHVNIEEKKQEWQDKKKDAEFQLKFFKDYGVEEKLQKQLDFDTDSRKCDQTTLLTAEYLDELQALIIRYEDDVKNQKLYKSKQNQEFFDNFFAAYDRVVRSLDMLKKALDEGKAGLRELNTHKIAFIKLKQGLKEEFAHIERILSEELKTRGAQAIHPEEFLQLRKTLEQATSIIDALEKQQKDREKARKELIVALTELNDLYYKEFKEIQAELTKINAQNTSLKIGIDFKADKDDFINYMKDIFRGSNIRAGIYKNLAQEFSDFSAMYKDLDKAKQIVGTNAAIFEDYFNSNLNALLTWQVPNKYLIEYKGKELRHHSLGQRASALILFVLSQKDNDVIIIDQPEDDLDNQTIYQDVIKLICSLKNNTQFIFATHNANFPVLGDAEQIITCNYSDDSITTEMGSIDCPVMQKNIVDIMEGGKEAFIKRKEIYEIWKPQSSWK